MKPQVAVMILSKLMEEGKLLLMHVTHKATSSTNPAYLIDFDGGLAHCYHITNTPETIESDEKIMLMEAWQDIEDWVAFSVQGARSLDEVKLFVANLNAREKGKPKNMLEFLQSHAAAEEAKGTTRQ